MKTKKNQFITVKTGPKSSIKLPNTKFGAWFNLGYCSRGEKYRNPVVTPSQLLSISQTSFFEICELADSQVLAELRVEIGCTWSKKVPTFQAIIDEVLAKRGAK